MTLRAKLLLVLIILGSIISVGYSCVVYQRALGQAHTDAQARAGELINRAVEMFMVSTRKFHEEWQNSKTDPEQQKKVLADWNRTIFAVDEAVIHDFGENAPRARLIGDEKIVGYRPLGGANTKIEIPFEEEAIQAFHQGETCYQTMDDNVLRVSVPLMAQAHPGCAECHYATEEGFDADMTRDNLLGTLNAYIPMKTMLQNARSNAIIAIVSLSGVMAILIVFIYLLINRYLVKPIQSITGSLTHEADEVTRAASLVGTASQSLAEGATEQAAGLEETSSSLEEMAAMTKENANNSQQANAFSSEARQSADTGAQAMTRMNEAIMTCVQRSGGRANGQESTLWLARCGTKRERA